MGERDDGGPAFPLSATDVLPMDWMGWRGMTLLDWFAGQALAGIVQDWPSGRDNIRNAADRAYLFADAMLAARKPKEPA